MIFDLIVPCFNPAPGWEKTFVQHLHKLKIEVSKTNFPLFQVFLINDGSFKNFHSEEINFVKKTGIPIRVIENGKNYGKGYSLRKGVVLANSPYSVYTDLDFPFGTESIVEILKNLEKGYDIVLGARSSFEYYRHATVGRRLISKSLMLVNRHLLHLPFEDTQAGIKGFNQTGKNIFLSTTINRFLFDLEFVKIACSFPDIRIQSICVANNRSLLLSSFGFKTLLIELINFIRILVKHNYVSGAKKILFGIDLEEFDIPEEFGQKIDLESKIMISKVGLQNLLPILDSYHIPVTFFTTAFWAKQQPEIILKLAARHEIASHTYYHNSFQKEDLQLSRIALSEISGTEVRGLRMPKMKMISPIDIQNAGYKYDSSLHPVYIPGRYNHLGAKKHVYKIDDIYEMPVSVSTPFRIPLFWLSFKNLPLPLYLSLCNRTLHSTGCLIIYFHPWEFTDLKSFKLPVYIKRLSGIKMLERINLLLKGLTQQGEFVTHSKFLESLEPVGK